jgi:hypothetical protein
MLSLLATDPSGQNAQLEHRLGDLTDILQQELRLIDELRHALLRQRAGVAADDSDTIDASVQAVGRTLLTLDEVRRRRAALTADITGAEGVPLADLENQLQRSLPAALEAARDGVRHAAEAAAREVAINQHVLRRALEAGDAFLQQLFSSASDPMPVYTPGPRPNDSRQSGVLLNRRA